MRVHGVCVCVSVCIITFLAWSGIVSDQAKKWSDMITHNISFIIMEGKTITDFGQWPTVASIRLDTLCVCVRAT